MKINKTARENVAFIECLVGFLGFFISTIVIATKVSPWVLVPIACLFLIAAGAISYPEDAA